MHTILHQLIDKIYYYLQPQSIYNKNYEGHAIKCYQLLVSHNRLILAHGIEG